MLVHGAGPCLAPDTKAMTFPVGDPVPSVWDWKVIRRCLSQVMLLVCRHNRFME